MSDSENNMYGVRDVVDLRVIPFAKDYAITPSGRVFSRRIKWTSGQEWREMKPQLQNTGYHSIFLRTDTCGVRSYSVHVLVLTVFVGERPNGYHAAHLDGNRANSVLENLRWVTRRENQSHMRLHGTALLGEKNHIAKLTTADIPNIREGLSSRTPLRILSAKYGVARQTLTDIRFGRTWNHVP